MTPWMLPAIVSLVLFGIATFLPKLMVRRLPVLHLTVLQSAFFLLCVLAVVAARGFSPGFDAKGAGLAALVGMVGISAHLSFLMALQRGTVTQVVAVSSLYPAISALLAVAFLDETLTARQWAGMAAGFCAILLAAQEKKA